MQHIILLGDSTLDNAAYVPIDSDVINLLRNKLPHGWKSTLLARDGSMINDIKYQLCELPEDASFLVLSVGGNNALSHADILNESASSVAEVLFKLADIQDEFQKGYHMMLKNVLSYNLPTVICTIYYPRFPDPRVQKLSKTALSIFNDCIIKEAIGSGLKLIDLRLIFDEDKDYATPIEPSKSGGEKIVNAILNKVKEHGTDRREI
ncbi:MAG: SGNH/GDSL hydrolase family protein [Deltaproteobacteria bacterium]|nr:SGNH/GDSL hydrolase family protein [Deltaproteobacteria bacterium]